MTYPSAYGPSFGSSYPQQAPPPRRRGMKRTIFGIIGLVLNAIGLFVMPIIAALVAAVIATTGMTPEPIEPRGGTYTADGMSILYLAVPAYAVASTTCEVEGADIQVDEDTAGMVVGEIDGVEYVSVYSINAVSEQQVTVHCEGTDSAAIATMGVVGFLITTGMGILIPIVLGLLSLVLLIWGIIALVRSTGNR